ncbi:MAG TPA: hypothetical protein VGK25_08185 [Ignavibacteria bacterium]|jgi:hypothetical protein
MKKTLLSLIFITAALIPAKLLAQSTTTMQDILETVTAKIVELEEDKNQEIVNVTFDLLVNEGKKTVWRFLDPAFTYDLSIIGDRRISKLKVTVYKQGKSDWEYVDEVSASNPKLKIYPSEYEQYEFTISVADFKSGNNTGHFAFMLYHDNPEKKK